MIFREQLCPANITNINAKENRHQLTLLIDDINNISKKIEKFNEIILQDIPETNNFLQASLKDIDCNSIVLKQNTK